MQTKTYHTRQGYERLYINLFWGHGVKCSTKPLPLKECSDYQLLKAIDSILTANNCIPMSHEELERDLQ